jgi:hypothetical protein
MLEQSPLLLNVGDEHDVGVLSAVVEGERMRLKRCSEMLKNIHPPRHATYDNYASSQ